jgi:xanthine dehydrogenase small subunit
VKTATSALSLRQPASLDEAFRMLRAERLTPLAGATDLFVGLNFGTLTARAFLDLGRLDSLRTIEVRDDVLHIGALATYTEIMQSPAVRERVPMLVAAAGQVGGVQIQNRGTLGGNIANGSPAGDSLPVLAAADATVVMCSADGERRAPFASFYTGYRASVLRPDELIVRVEIPRIEGAQWFRKVGTRAAQAISKLVMAGVRGPSTTRLALGSVAPTVVRLSRTEAVLSMGDGIDEAIRALDAEIAPIDDIRSTAEYRRRVAANLLRRFWSDTA